MIHFLRSNLNEARVLNRLVEEAKEGLGQPKCPTNLLHLLGVRGQNQVAQDPEWEANTFYNHAASQLGK